MNGCDADARAAVFERTCERCMGAKLVGIDVLCDLCNGAGTISSLRCASSQTDDLSRIVVTTMSHYLNGHLPSEGGWGDQSAWLLDAMAVALHEKYEIDEARAQEVSSGS